MARGGKRQSLVKYSEALSNVICDNVEDGITVAELCRNPAYKEHGFPIERTIYRWKKQYPEFKVKLETAYQTLFYRKIDELDYLAKLKYEPEPGDDPKVQWAKARAFDDSIKRQIDVIKYTLANIASKLVPELRNSPTTAIQVQPIINVLNYKKSE